MNLLRAASTVSLLTLISRVAGLVRDTLVASYFGAGAATDAFNVAFRIPNLFRRLFAEGAFSLAFVPMLAATREREGDVATHALVDAVATVLAWVLVATCIVGVAAAPLLVWVLAAGLADFDGAVVMTRLMFPYIGLMSMVALSAGILNTWRRFAVPALTPVLLNVGIISATVFVSPLLKRHGIDPIYALAAGVMAGGLLQGAIQIPALARLGLLPRIGLSRARLRQAWAHPGVHAILARMGPAVLGVSVAQISAIINTQIASHIAVGAVSWLYYADRLMEFPAGLLGVAMGVVLLPQLAAAQGRRDDQAYSDMLDWGLRLTLLLTLPCAIALLVFPQALVATLFEHGAFTAEDVVKTSHALMGYGVGLMGLIAIKVLAPGFYARQDTRTPVKIAIGVLIATQAMNAVFVPFLGHAGLTLAIGLGAILNAGLLLAGLLRLGVYRPRPGWGLFALRVAGACVLLGAALAFASTHIDWVGLRGHAAQRAAWLAAVLAVVAAGYFGVLAASGLDLRQFGRRA
ncbi:MAG: murein biosynthesis integral membrane protein MurJ [Burkholderiales bacterium]|nr:murein biosynthesis integral membrane protein MurJ [Burkholderiales bacterium]MDE2398466.1 murein biosynthesis integral membrane protein MurJ [Burkholderiales bacterium]MDE2454989.1 murein biosynthesis integral membrane protein MurJ [Burkholderiales bacterium]